MIGVRIELRDLAKPALQRARGVLEPATLNRIVGESATLVYREHLRNLERTRPNRLGGRRTHFYGIARDETSFNIDNDGVTVSIRSVGIRQRYFGGPIKPKAAKYLTIPVHPAAHGRPAREFDLRVIFGRGGQPIALATKETSYSRTVKNAEGKRVKQQATRPIGEVYYILTKKTVQQRPDPSVLPLPDVVGGAVVDYVNRRLDRAIGRQGGAA